MVVPRRGYFFSPPIWAILIWKARLPLISSTAYPVNRFLGSTALIFIILLSLFLPSTPSPSGVSVCLAIGLKCGWVALRTLRIRFLGLHSRFVATPVFIPSLDSEC